MSLEKNRDLHQERTRKMQGKVSQVPEVNEGTKDQFDLSDYFLRCTLANLRKTMAVVKTESCYRENHERSYFGSQN